jgi:hypothetical protein
MELLKEKTDNISIIMGDKKLNDEQITTLLVDKLISGEYVNDI